MKLKLLNDFRKNEEGGILAFFLIMFLMLVVGGGMAVDFMNSEYQRERVQDALDRGVLAAAAIGKDARAVTAAEIAAAEAQSVLIVKSYLSAAGYDPEAPGVSIVPDFTLNSQQVDATAAFEVDTFFLRLSGIDTLGGRTASGAMVTQNDIEISLVLDVSGSMGGGKITNLRAAGSDFVGNMLAGERSDYTFINLIPFNHGINMPLPVYSMFDSNMWHPYNGCGAFTPVSYASNAINPATDLMQTTHYPFPTYDWTGYNWANWPAGTDPHIVSWEDQTCNVPQSIVYSNNAAELQASITSYQAVGATAGFVGVKWAAGLLDPSAGSVVTSLIASGDVDVNFAGKPAAYSEENTLKFIVFMSDGSMNNAVIHGDGYDQAVDGDGNPFPRYSIQNADFWATYQPSFENPPPENVVLNSSGPTGPNPLLAACNTADDAGIIVFTIAYGLTPGGAADIALSNCASSLGHHFNVATADLDAAFASIEASIQRLRLTN